MRPLLLALALLVAAPAVADDAPVPEEDEAPKKGVGAWLGVLT